MPKPRVFTPAQKAIIALEAIKEEQTIAQIASSHSVHPTQVKRWKQAAKDGLAQTFEVTGKTNDELVNLRAEVDELHRLIGVREAEIEWLKKKTAKFAL